MTNPSESPADEDIARLAYSLWERDGSPDGRDQEYWFIAKELLTSGGSEVSGEVGEAREPREVQPGFQDAAPGLVPDMKEDPAPDLPETPGGRFAKQIAEAPEEGQDKPRPQ